MTAGAWRSRLVAATAYFMSDPAAALQNKMTSAYSDADVMGQLSRKPGFLLARVDQIATALHGARTPVATLAQSELLLCLDRLGPVPQITLARAAGLDKSTNGLVLDNMQARGWIDRTPCPQDRRLALITLTEAGEDVLPDVRTTFTALQSELLAPITPSDAPRLLAMLRRLGGNPLSPAPLWRIGSDEHHDLFDNAPNFLTRRVLQHLQATFAARAPEARTTMRQFALLFVVAARGPITQTSIARLYGLDPSTCAVILRVLTKRRWLSSERSDQDGRERVHQITEIGATALEALQGQAERSEQAALRGETTADRRWLVEQLRLIVAATSHLLRFPGLFPSIPNRN